MVFVSVYLATEAYVGLVFRESGSFIYRFYKIMYKRRCGERFREILNITMLFSFKAATYKSLIELDFCSSSTGPRTHL